MDYTDKHYYNTENLIPLSRRQHDLLKQIEEADWLEQDSSSLQNDYDDVIRLVKQGDVYIPMF
jgi:hypothetical protein